MANYAASVLAKGQAKLTAKWNAPEQRRQMPSILSLALQNQHISIPDAQTLRTSPLRPVDVNFFTNIAAGSATAKVAAHTGTYGDTAAINVTYVSHVETFSLPRKLAANNIFSYEEQFNNLYEMKWKNLRTRHDNSALAYLIANRCQLAATVINPETASANAGTWNGTNFALEIAPANNNLFIQYGKSFMDALYYTGPYDIVADLQIGRNFEFEKNQGSSNANNYSFQFGNASVYQTQNLISSAYPKGAALFMPQGAFAGLNWNELLNRQGVNAGENSVGMLGTTADPLGSGAVADISMYTARADTSSNTTGGSTQDIVDQWELTLTIGYITPPLSLTSDSTVFEIAQT